MKRMTLVMKQEDYDSGDDEPTTVAAAAGTAALVAPARNSSKYECENCHAEFPNKTSADRHMLFCKTLAEIRRGSGSSVQLLVDDPLMPTPREMFILIQELAAKYNKVKDELDVMKQWAKMVGRRIGGSVGGGGGATAAAAAGLDFTSITRQKRQNLEVILNEEDDEHPDLAELRPSFTQWLVASPFAITSADLNVVFNEDLIAGISAAILRVLAGYTAESGRSHLVPFKLADIKQGAFYIYDTAFGVTVAPPSENATDLPTPRKWRAMEPCEFQLLVRTFHKLLFQEFKKWQDLNWEAQKQMTQQRHNAASSYQQMMAFTQCSPAMASCDGEGVGVGAGAGVGVGAGAADDEPVVSGAVLSEDFATLYNKYADKMMGGALSDDTILTRVRAKLWKDMKAWRL